jgi:poly(A)-specific ribonuclease
MYEAVDFLMRNGFRMDAPFTEGLPYLSREEETRAKARLLERQQQKAAIRDIDVRDMDLESLEFLNDVRRQIDAWMAVGDVGLNDISQNGRLR